MPLPNTSPVHVGVPWSKIYPIAATANTNRDGTGTISDITPAPTAGKQSLAARLKITATGVTTAGMVRLFAHDGTGYKLFMELSVAAVPSPGATTKTAIAGAADNILDSQGFLALNMPIGDTVAGNAQKIGASTHNAEGFTAMWVGDGDYQ